MRILYYIILTFLSPVVSAQIQVSLFNSLPVKGLVVSSYQGQFGFYSAHEKIREVVGNKPFYITLYNNSLLLADANGPIGYYADLSIQPETDSAKLLISLVDPATKGRVYSGNINFRIEYGRILILNEIKVEDYIAGVVEAETGINAFPEFYKAQALLCRTYLYSHLSRHESEGFNLCDEVHCQAYKGSTAFTSHVLSSTSETAGKVIFSPKNELITAAFHANCGGRTESSLHVWLKPESYLEPVNDPYCAGKGNANWEKKIPLNEWKKYLNAHGIKIPSSLVALEMKKKDRQVYYRINNDSILTKQIRADWNLKSSFFQVHVKNNMVHILGQGYGHGVGLCQDGAMNMAKKGFSYDKIIDFYFNNVSIIKMP